MFRWGIMGTGFISSQFAKGVAAENDMEIYAAASVSGRNPYGIRAEKYYTSYEEMAKDPMVDAVYVGTIHTQHLSCAKIALGEGKPVLCEKPLTINGRELDELLELAKETHTFFMEAMWSRYLPAVRYLREVLQEKRWGETNYMHITFGTKVDRSARRIFDVRMGGGALLDVGVYGISLADFWMGQEPEKMHSFAVQTEDTVDLDTSIQLFYPNGAMADMTFSVSRNLTDAAHIVTDRAEFTVPYFWRPDTIYHLAPKGNFAVDRLQEKLDFPIEGNGYNYEAREVKRCVEQGLLESPDMTWRESRKIMEMMDAVRRQCGIRYPQDLI